MLFSEKWLRNHPKFLLHFLIHIDQTWGQIHASVFELQIQILHMSQIQIQIQILPFMSVFQLQIQILIFVFEIPIVQGLWPNF